MLTMSAKAVPRAGLRLLSGLPVFARESLFDFKEEKRKYY